MQAVDQPFQPTEEEIEAALSGLRILRELGSGGQKVVFAAESSEGEVALKLIRPGPPSSLDRAKREIETLKQMKDRHFPRIFRNGTISVGEWGNVIYILEELLRGESLRQRLATDSKLQLNEALAIVLEILEALTVLEEIPIVHRDIKPENVFMEPDRVVLLDFGIIRHLALKSLTHDLALFGPCTPGYGAPEQIRNEKRTISVRSDLFAVGVVLYEMLTGINPFADSDPRKAIEKTLRLDPPPLLSVGIPQNVSQFVERCLQKSPHRRVPSARLALDECRRLLA